MLIELLHLKDNFLKDSQNGRESRPFLFVLNVLPPDRYLLNARFLLILIVMFSIVISILW